MNKFIKSRLITFSKINSRKLSIPESKLWFEVLISRKLEGLKFVKQKVIDKFIVDFYCHELKLIIELDGNSHDGIVIKDQTRDDSLNKFGYVIVRVLNRDVLENIDGVNEYLKIKVRKIVESRGRIS